MKKFEARGIVHMGLLMVVLAVAALVITVVVAGNGTGFLNQATSGQATYQGTVRRVTPCVQGNLCFQLVQTKDGKNHYLLVRKGLFASGGPDLAKFVGVETLISGQEINRVSGKAFVLVLSAEKVKNKQTSTLPVTEFGVILPVPPTGVPVVPPATGPVGNGQFELLEGGNMSGRLGTTCLSRPACLDSVPHCEIAEPADGWCPPSGTPTPVPSCVVRPDCADGITDSNGNIVYCDPQPGTVWCPPKPPGKSAFMLRTGDGRNYLLEVAPLSQPCNGKKPCPEMMIKPISLIGYVGKTVLVEGVMTMEQQGCLNAKPPCKVPTKGWWPLPNNEMIKVKAIQLAAPVASGVTLTDVLQKSAKFYSGEQVYQFKNLKPCGGGTFPCISNGVTPTPTVYVRDSFEDLASRLGKNTTLTGDVFLVGGRDYFLNVSGPSVAPVPTSPPPPQTSHMVCVDSSCQTVQGSGSNQCQENSDCQGNSNNQNSSSGGSGWGQVFVCHSDADCQSGATGSLITKCINGTCRITNSGQFTPL